jgi:hypothetical protein
LSSFRGLDLKTKDTNIINEKFAFRNIMLTWLQTNNFCKNLLYILFAFKPKEILQKKVTWSALLNVDVVTSKTIQCRLQILVVKS